MCLEETVQDLTGELPNTLVLSADVDPTKYNQFFKEHDHISGPRGAIGGGITYKFTPADLKTLLKVKCACGGEADVTSSSVLQKEVKTIHADINPTAYREFIESHDLHNSSGEYVEKTSFQFTHTSIGTVVRVKCACGHNEDISDYDSW